MRSLLRFEVELALLKALGIDPAYVSAFTIEGGMDQVMTITTISHRLPRDDEDMSELVETMTKYRLAQIEPEGG